MGAEPSDLVVADFDMDGRDDIVAANRRRANTSSPNQVNALGLSDSSARDTYGVGEMLPTRVTRGDFDGDGQLDVVVGGEASNHLRSLFVLAGNDEGLSEWGVFGSTREVVALANGPVTDGNPQTLVVLTEVALEVYDTVEPGVEPAAVLDVVLGSDVVVCGESIYVSKRSGEIHEFVVGDDMVIEPRVVGDLGSRPILALSCAQTDGDDSAELFATTMWDTTPADELPEDLGELLVVDLGVDSMDVVDKVTLRVPAPDVAAGDFNADGVDDFAVVGAYDNAVTLYLSADEGYGEFATWGEKHGPRVFEDGCGGHRAPGLRNSVAFGDFNGDSLPDIVVTDQFDNEVELIVSTP